MNDEQLQAMFGFDGNELAANRGGYLTEKQKQAVQHRSLYKKMMRSVLGAIYFAIAAGIVVALYFLFPSFSTNEKILWTVFAVIFVLIMGFIGLFFTRGLLNKTNLAVERVEGPVNIVQAMRNFYDSDAKVSRDYPFHELTVGDKKFEVPGSLTGLVMQGDSYAVYYTGIPGAVRSAVIPTTDILSIERLI